MIVITAVYVRNTQIDRLDILLSQPSLFLHYSRIAFIQYLFGCIMVHLLQLNDQVLLFLQKRIQIIIWSTGCVIFYMPLR